METQGSTHSSAGVWSRLKELEAELQEKQDNLMRAAMYGKTLLEDNTGLRDQIDDLMKQHAAVLENKEQELCNLKSRLEMATSMEKWQQDELSTLRNELQKATEQTEEERRRETAAHKKRVELLQTEVDRLQSAVQSLQSQNSELEALVTSHLNRTQLQNTSTSFSTSEEIAVLSEELAKLQIDLTEAQAKSIEVSGQLQQCQREKDALSSRLRSAQEENEDLQRQALTYARHLEEARKKMLELRAQVEVSTADQELHYSKGNSIFSELEDRRLAVEKSMSALKIQNEQLKEKYNMEKLQNSKYKKQIAMALQMNSRQVDATALRLREQLREAYEEIRTLMDRVQHLESSKNDLSAGEKWQGDTDQFFLATLRIEKDRASKAQSELHAKQLQYLDVSQRNTELSCQVRQLEADNDRLKAQILSLITDKDELLAKYEPDKVKVTAMQPKRVIEKIDLGDAEIRTADSIFPASGRPSSIFQPCVPTGRLSSVFKPSVIPSGSTTGKPSNVFKAKTGNDILKPVNAQSRTGQVSDFASRLRKDADKKLTSQQKENDADPTPGLASFPAARSVTMSKEVEVIYTDGDNSITTLVEEKSGAPLKRKERKTTPMVKCVKGDEGPELQCKTQ